METIVICPVQNFLKHILRIMVHGFSTYISRRGFCVLQKVLFTKTNVIQCFVQIILHSGANIKCYLSTELWTIRTLANSALVNSDPKKFGPSQFGPRPLVNSDLDHWSIRAFFIGQFGPQNEKFFGQFGPFQLVNSDLFYWSIRTFSFSQFGPFPLVNSDLRIKHFP